MNQQDQTIKSKIIILQGLISTQPNSQITSLYLQQITSFLQNSIFPSQGVQKCQVYGVLRDTVRTIFQYLSKTNNSNQQKQEQIDNLIKKLLLAICNFCSLYYFHYYPIGCGDMIKQFLSSDCRLFVFEYTRINEAGGSFAYVKHEVEDKDNHNNNVKNWTWAKQSTFKTVFYGQCLEIIMRNLNNFNTKFGEMKVIIIKQYIHMLYYLDQFLVTSKIHKLVQDSVQILQKLFLNPTKQIMNNVNKQNLQQLIDYLSRLLKNLKNQSLKTKIQYLGPLLGISMLKMPSIQKKIAGCKIISKFSYEMMYRNTSYINQSGYSDWIISNGYFQLVYQQQIHVSLIKASEQTFKLLVKKSKISKQKYHKFFDIMDKADNEIRKAMLRSIQAFRLDFSQIQFLIDIFKTIKTVDFYDEDMFYFLQSVSRYSTSSQLKTLLNIVEIIVNTIYDKFESYITKRKCLECYAYVFERLIIYKDMEERVESYVNAAVSFINDPSLNKLVIVKTLFDNLSEHKIQSKYQQIICSKIINQHKFIQKTVNFISDKNFKQDLTFTIKIMLKKYSKYSCNGENHKFTSQQLLQCVNYPEIFEQILKLLQNTDLQLLLNQLSNLTSVKQFSFQCFKQVFIRLNMRYLKPIKKQWTQYIATYATDSNPYQLKGIQNLKYIIYNSNNRLYRLGACQLLTQIFTNFTIDFRTQGQQYLITFLSQCTSLFIHNFKQFFMNNLSLNTLKGTLQLIQCLMLNTQYFGVGHLKSHNSLVPTSTVSIKIYNNVTHGDDVLKIFQKKFPSNKTLYEVLVQVSRQFKMAPLDIAFEYPNSSTINHNGLTLQQLKLNKMELNVVKLLQSRLKRQHYIIDGQLNQKARQVFTQMFKRFAPDGKMGEKQCANYIEAVTQSSCTNYDTRISSLFADYDKDRDNFLMLADFIKFYEDCVMDPDKIQSVDKNLSNLRYRKDLKQYDEEIDNLKIQVLMRFHLCLHAQIYNYLFKLSYYQDVYISDISKRLLLRLPTQPSLSDSFNQETNFKNKNSFQVQYMLIALQSQIMHQADSVEKLISHSIHHKIFQYFTQLYTKSQKSNADSNCLIICLHILRSLIKIQNIKDFKQKIIPAPLFTLPQSTIFIDIIRQNIKKGDTSILEPAFALQFTQNKLQIDWIEQSAFNRDKDIRILTCNFLFMWSLKYGQKQLQLFKIQIRQNNNQQWFNLLTSIIQIGGQINYHQLFNTKLQVVINQKQSLQQNRFNQIIHGNLRLIQSVYPYLTQQQKNILNKSLDELLPSLISNQNRQIVYDIRINSINIQFLSKIYQLTNFKSVKESQPRYKFVGIKNLGCICYMNSILQQFYMNQSFKKLIMSLTSSKQYTVVNNISLVDDFLYQLQNLYINLDYSQKQYFDPTLLTLCIKDSQGIPMQIHIQEDAHQFLNTIFDKIQNYTKKQQKLNVLEHIYGGKTVTKIICLTCKNQIERLEHFYHLTVEVKGMKTLQDSLDKMIQPQQIQSYNCQNCKQKVQKISKQTLIKQAPQILIINLQRITFDLQAFIKVKIHSKLQFDQIINLQKYFSSRSQPAQYRLKGVVIHSGTSQGGHYYSLIKSQNQWYKFNDQSVTYFSQNDLGRETFGGQQQTDTWGDYSSSTNAYILFYERIKQKDEQVKYNLQQKVNKTILEEVKQENINFKKQLQVYQSSFFNLLNNVYKQSNENQKNYIYDIYQKIFYHLAVNSDIKNQLIKQFTKNFIQLLSAIPQKTKQLLNNIKINQYIDNNIITNNDICVRELFSVVLYQILKTNSSQKAIQATNYLITLLDNQIFIKNIHKSSCYFQLLLRLSSLQKYTDTFINGNILQKLLLILMGSQNLNGTKDKSKPQLNTPENIQVNQIIISMLKLKKNKVGKSPFQILDQDIVLYDLTEKQIKIFSQPNFYRKILKKHQNTDIIMNIAKLMPYQDLKFTKFIIQVLIKALNNNDEIQDKSIVLQAFKSLLTISDQYSKQRVQWVLGVPQLEFISDYKYEYGIIYSPQSKVISYVSNLFYIKQDKYMPLLQTLFNKRKYYNSFSAFGAINILKLSVQSKQVRQYILKLPPPAYSFKTYYGWIQNYISRVRIQEHYGLPMQKNALAECLQQSMKKLKSLIQEYQFYNDLPINKKVIGKTSQNKKLQFLDQQTGTGIKIYFNYTYTLPNIHNQKINQTLKLLQNSCNSFQACKYSQFFSKTNQIQEDVSKYPEISTQLSILTFFFFSKKDIIVHFALSDFKYKFNLRAGENIINCFYNPKDFDQSQIYNIDIKTIVSISYDEKDEEDNSKTIVTQQLTQMTSNNYNIADFIPQQIAGFKEGNCPVCTFYNVDRTTCEMCDTTL